MYQRGEHMIAKPVFRVWVKIIGMKHFSEQFSFSRLRQKPFSRNLLPWAGNQIQG